MPIEFGCSGCRNQLRVADEHAGKDARCPQCGAINRVPDSASTFSARRSDETAKKDWAFGEAGQSTAPSPFGAAAINPYAAPQAASYEPDYGQQGPRAVGAETVFNHAFKVWQDNLGLLVGVTVVIAAVSWVFSVFLGMIQFALMQDPNGRDIEPFVRLLGGLTNQAIQLFLGIGEAQIALKLARGQRAEFGDLFGGGKRFLPVVGISILLGLTIVLGYVLLIVPGIILTLMLWPAYYLVLDEKAGIIESFSQAAAITKGNWGNVFVLGLFAFGIMLLGLLAVCIGLIFAAGGHDVGHRLPHDVRPDLALSATRLRQSLVGIGADGSGPASLPAEGPRVSLEHGLSAWIEWTNHVATA
jgi:hypothetical protein